MEIVIINQHANNFGDEAAVIALIEELINKFQDVHITIHYLGDGVIRYTNEAISNFEYRLRDFGSIRIVMRIVKNLLGIKFERNKVLKAFGNSIYKADYIFVSPSGADLGHYNGWSALTEILLVVSYGKNVIFHLNSIDRSPCLLFETIKRMILKKNKIYVREKNSTEYLDKIGIKSKFGIDTAFLLKKPNVPKERYISFVYSEYNFHFTDAQKVKIKNDIKQHVIIPLIKYASENRFIIKLIPHMNTKEEMSYLKNIKNFFDKIIEGVCEIADDVYDAFEYQIAIARSTVMISMRYHGLVMAAKNGIPFISLSYDSKMDEVSSYCGNSKYNHSLDDLSSFNIVTELDEILNNYDSISSKIIKNISFLLVTASIPVCENIIEDKNEKL